MGKGRKGRKRLLQIVNGCCSSYFCYLVLGNYVGFEMAKNDDGKFLAIIIIVAIVFCLILPVEVLMYLDIYEIRETIRAEAKDLRKLKKEVQKSVQSN